MGVCLSKYDDWLQVSDGETLKLLNRERFSVTELMDLSQLSRQFMIAADL